MQDSFLSLYTLGDLKLLCWRWRRLMVITFAAVFIPAAAVTLLMPPTYRATSRLLLNRESRVPDYNIRSGAEGSGLFRQVNQKEELTTEAERLRSRSVIAPVVAKLALTPEKLTFVRDVRLYVRRSYDWIVDSARGAYNETRWALHISRRPSPEEVALYESYALLEDVVGRASVTVVPDSNIIEIAFHSSDQLLARDVCNAIVEEYLRQRSRKSQAGAHEFFQQQSVKMAEDLRQHEKHVDAMERQFSVYSVDEQRRLILASMASTDEQLKATRTNLARLSRKAAFLPQQLSAEPETITTATDVNRNPTFDLVNQRVIELELARVKALDQFQPTSQMIQNLDQQLRVAKDLQASVPKTLDGSSTRSVNPVHQSLKAELLNAQSEIASLEAQAQSLEGALVTYRTQLDALGQNSLQVRDSRRQVEAEEQAYAMYLKNQEQARVADALQTSDLSELRVIDPAPLPLYQMSPRPRIYLGVAAATALLMAFGLALLADQNALPLATQAQGQITDALDLPVLASFPVAPVERLEL